MFYVFTHSVLTTDISTSKKEIEMPLTAGIIHQVDVLFQDGCDHAANVQIFKGNQQLWPTNRGAALIGNATVISFRDFVELKGGATVLTAFIWGDGVIDAVDVIIQIGLLPKNVLQPLSFEELLAAAAGFST